MKFNIVRARFIDGLKAVQNIVSGKGALPILQNVLIETNEKGIRFTTTDLDISVTSEVECEVIEAGSTTLPVKFLSTMVLKLVEGIVEVSVDENDRCTIAAGSAKVRLNGINAREFPQLPASEESSVYKLNQSVFKEMLRKTSYAASQDDTRRTLKGVLMRFKEEKLTMVATDGRRLALIENEMEFPVAYEKDIVLPFKAVQELQRSLTNEGEVEISACKSQICFKTEKFTIYSKLMEETYPNYQQVIPRECKEHVVIDRQLLLDAIDRASVMTMDEAHSTKLTFEGNLLTVSAADATVGEAKDEVEIKYAGEKIEIMFNPSYVMDPLKAIDDDEICFEIENGQKPAVIKCNTCPFIYVLMPLRIS